MRTHYDPVAITLHWVIALAMIFMIPYGFFMEDLPDTLRRDGVTLHKSIGLTILALSIFRLVWRFLNPPPALPAGISRWERIASKSPHWLFYALIIGLPLSGWLMVSASQKYPTIFFWLGTAPFIPLPEDMINKQTARQFHDLHEWITYGGIALIALHVGALVKHHWIDKTPLLYRMLPKRKAA